MDTLLRAVDATSRGPTIASLWSEVSGRDLDDRDLQWPADVFALAEAGSAARRWALQARGAVVPPQR
jgi:hypothetical protein